MVWNNQKIFLHKLQVNGIAAAYSFIKITVSNAVIPIAACFLTFIFALQMINMVKESNQLHNVKPQNMILVLITLAICLTICARSFEIVNGLFEISKWATTHMPGGLPLLLGLFRQYQYHEKHH